MKASEKLKAAKRRQKQIEKPLCPECGSEDMTRVSTGKAKGDLVRYFDCMSCFRSWKQWRGQLQERSMANKDPKLQQDGVLKESRIFVDGRFVGIGIKGARVFVDGKFIGIVK